ncbi:MAG: hypothetical protein SGPRY_009154, partial [Prymnesium sp.]
MPATTALGMLAVVDGRYANALVAVTHSQAGQCASLREMPHLTKTHPIQSFAALVALTVYVQSVIDTGVPKLAWVTARGLWTGALKTIRRLARLLHAVRMASCVFVMILAVTFLTPKVEGKVLEQSSLMLASNRVNWVARVCGATCREVYAAQSLFTAKHNVALGAHVFLDDEGVHELSVSLGMETTRTKGGSHPRTKCVSMNIRDSDGRRMHLILRGALILPDSRHNLISMGKLAIEQRMRAWVAPELQPSYLQAADGVRIHVLNVGVLVLPDYHAQVWKDALHERTVHPHCDACMRARADSVPSKSHAPHTHAPGELVSMDVYTTGVPHVHGGQRYVIGFHDHYSRMDK